MFGPLSGPVQFWTGDRGQRRLDPKLVHLGRRLAVLYDQQGESAKALAEYRAAVERTPNDADPLNDFGFHHLSQGNFPEAEKWLRKSLARVPNHEHALTNLGIALARQGRTEECLKVFEQAVGPAAAHSNLGVILAQMGQRDRAVREFQAAMDLDSSLGQPRAFLAKLDEPQDTNSGQVIPAGFEFAP